MSAGPGPGTTVEMAEDPARRAYERASAKAGGRLIETFAAHTVQWEKDGFVCMGTTPVAPMEGLFAKGTENYLFCGHSATAMTGLHVSGSRNTVYVGAFSEVSGSTIHIIGDDSVIFIGAFTRIHQGAMMQALRQGTTMIVGERCHIGERCIITNSDGHGIYLAKDGKRINPERDVLIDDHAFVGYDSRVHKGSVVEPDGIVLERSMVSGRIRSGCVYHGVPATLREEGVSWSSTVDAATIEEAEAADARLLEQRMGELLAKSLGQPSPVPS